MVSNVTSLTGNGLKDWLIQRVTAVYFAAYSLFLLGFLLWHPHLAYHQWQALFACNWFKVASLIAVLALSLHAWVGIWTVTTDYMKCTVLRLAVQMAVVTWLLAQFIWVLMIVWGQ
ncbi:succinate dehydrogenase, hydrophobic membrane anchor protein [Legionella spiritensis]|uniref:Succinate dehydrogenase hydrophobic membrane anchor subunit n=1 Tax=Legionella spiritensis TaxID=452 RepID=A0A0W0Z6X6_LEGSP|nr:succinate dehydrogenase, hydrophobic membrane anchor protein [Legionella spiritensis]KTD64686.1 succinate dehydrogenase, hydrophobic membrane anchor protein [Legionella spiritensis]SNV47881.1 succinate dehydrogenase, hydrophobic membrane anchor protein [Legionella spiritensis]VEG91366.1 succinate dehydrogenase, hydrophobic membrane anchor protein [Legionella spiritensis]